MDIQLAGADGGSLPGDGDGLVKPGAVVCHQYGGIARGGLIHGTGKLAAVLPDHGYLVSRGQGLGP